MLEDDCGDIRSIRRERVNDSRRRPLAPRQGLRKRAAHQRRKIIEQHDHGAFGGGAIVWAEIGVEIGACQCAGRCGTLAGGSGTDPVQKLTNNHALTPTRQEAIPAQCALRPPHNAANSEKPSARALIKGSP